MKHASLGKLILVTLVLFLTVPRLASAAESYDNCTGFITSLPAVVTTQGTWCLKKDLSTAMTSGSAIDIQTNNVTIDCNDFKLGGLAAGVATETYGMYADNRHNIVVRHCNIRGFLYGINFWGIQGGGHVVEDNKFDGNTYIGLRVSGNGSTVRRNAVSDTGGSTAASAGGGAVGIFVQYAVDIIDNTVSGVAATAGTNANAVAISMFHSYSNNAGGNTVSGNRVRGLSGAGTGVSEGFSSYAAPRIILRNNDFVGDSSAGSTGIDCYANDSHAKDNVINGFVTGIVVCSDDGNVISP